MPYPGFKKNRDQDESQLRSQSKSLAERDKHRRKVEIDTAGQTETFFSANAKLITFIVCMVVILALIGPWSVFRMIKWYEERQEEQNEMPITREQLERLIARGSALNWVDFDGYTYEVVVEKAGYIRKYAGENDGFYLLVTSGRAGGPVESVVLVDIENGHEQTELKAAQ